MNSVPARPTAALCVERAAALDDAISRSIEPKMPFQLELESREDYLFYRPSGKITTDALVDLGEQIYEACSGHGKCSALIDCSAIEGALPVAELFVASEKFNEKIGPLIKVAYINPPPHWNVQDDQFSRDVIVARGGMIKLFASQDDAEAWFNRDD